MWLQQHGSGGIGSGFRWEAKGRGNNPKLGNKVVLAPHCVMAAASNVVTLLRLFRRHAEEPPREHLNYLHVCESVLGYWFLVAVLASNNSGLFLELLPVPRLLPTSIRWWREASGVKQLHYMAMVVQLLPHTTQAIPCCWFCNAKLVVVVFLFVMQWCEIFSK